MRLTAPVLGWSGLLGAGVIASVCAPIVQLVFAGLAIGVVGMAHGASDLAIVAQGRRGVFLVFYAAAFLLCLAWWIVAPAIALPAFLLASALHFGLEDAPKDRPIERLARGTSLVATPATLHVASLQGILLLAGVPGDVVPFMVHAMALAGGVAAVGLVVVGTLRDDRRLLAGTASLLLLPPLVGFAIGFLILHAVPQTIARRVQLRCATTAAYLRATSPILAAALVLVAIVAGLVLRWDPSGMRSLFAGIAALAMPHLLVTPWFETIPQRSDVPRRLTA